MFRHFATINGVPTETFTLEQFTAKLDLKGVKSTSGPKVKISMNRIGGKIMAATKPIFKKAAYDLRADLKAAWPVDTGRSRDGWKIRANQYDWTVTNNTVNPVTKVPYIDKLWWGMPVGSPQMPMGGEPILRANAARLKINLAREVG